MKTEGNKWSSVDEVLDSFNNLSVMPSARRTQENDIFSISNTSPPKHRISPSQVELLESLGGCKLNLSSPQPCAPPPMSMGRGRIMKNLEKLNVLERDAALCRDVRAAKSSIYSNAAIETFFNKATNPNFEDDNISEDSRSSDERAKSPDQMPINNSILRPEAEAFYPSSVTPPNPSELALYLKGLKEEREAVSSFCKNSMPPYSARNKPKRSDNHIGFKFENKYIGSEEVNDSSKSNNVDNSSYLDSITTYSSISESCSSSLVNLSTSASPFPEPSLDFRSKEIPIPTKTPQVIPSSSNLDSNKEPRPKRVMKNALLSSLTLQQQVEPQHLMKPMDFNLGSSSSAFRPIASEHSKSNVRHLDCPYNFQSDMSIDSETKDLINYLTSESESGSAESPSHEYSKRAKKFSKSSNYDSPFDYEFKEQDFPPLS